jgi:hypothetical protein
MLDLKKIEISDRAAFLELLKYTEYQNSEFSFANIFIWQKTFDIKLAVKKDTIYISSTIPATGRYVHFQPICTENSDIHEVFRNIQTDIENHGEKFCIASANDYCLDIIEKHFPSLKAEEIPDMFDYVYLTEDLSELSGKRYHKKRTHINKFNKQYDYEYKRIDDSNKLHCMEITDKWIEGLGSDPYNERSAVELALENMEELELFGAIIYVDDTPAAFTIGEALKDDMALIHLEKATFEHRGAYPIINQQFAKRELLGKFKYVNREEDMGIEGIRHAKRSYHPYKMVKKYDIFEK